MQAILEANPGARVAVAIVWLPMIASDQDAAPSHSVSLVPDPRATHFYDAQRVAGLAVAASIGAPGEVAWDMYLFYDPASAAPPPETQNLLSSPATWFHQLAGREWADPTRYRWSEHLVEALSSEASTRWSP